MGSLAHEDAPMRDEESRYQPLACELYDYLEMACLYGYQLRIELVDGGSFDARALDTRTNAHKEEYLVIELDGEKEELRTDRLLAITPLNDNAKFGRVELAGQYCKTP